MVFSQACMYGIRASLYIAAKQNDHYLPINEISRDLGISFHFLTKILQKLTQRHLLKSYRGPNGGVTFAKSPDQIRLYEIVEAIDGDDLFTECILGLPDCGSQQACPLHEQWGSLRDELKSVMEETSLAALSARINSMGLRLTDFEQALEK